MDNLLYGYEPPTEDEPLAVQFVWELSGYDCFPEGLGEQPYREHRLGVPVYGDGSGTGRWVLPGWATDSKDFPWLQFGAAKFFACYSDDQYTWHPARIQGDPAINLTGKAYYMGSAYGGSGTYNRRYLAMVDDYKGYHWWSYDGRDWYQNMVRHPHHYPEYKGFWGKATGEYYDLGEASLMTPEEIVEVDLYNSAMGWAYATWCNNKFLAFPMNNKGYTVGVTSAVFLDPIDEAVYSPDGTNWITMSQRMPRRLNWGAPIYALGRYWAHGYEGTWWFRGELTNEWKERLIPGVDFVVNNGAYASEWRAGSGSYLLYSTDGTNWVAGQEHFFPGADSGLMLAEGAGLLFVLPYGSAVGYYLETYNSTPVPVILPAASGYKGLIFGHDRFIAFDWYSRRTAVSEDGKLWREGELLPPEFGGGIPEWNARTSRDSGYAPVIGGSGHFMVAAHDQRSFNSEGYALPVVAYGHWPWE